MKKILVVVDMQNDFIDGALGTPEAERIVPAVIEKIKSYPKENVYFTMDTHYAETYLKTEEGKNLPILHCISDTDGWELHKDILPLVDDFNIYEKHTFGSLPLAHELYGKYFSNKEYLSNKEVFEIELVGLCTDICVISNAILLKTLIPEAKISVDVRCCAGTTPEKHYAAIETMKSCQIHIV